MRMLAVALLLATANGAQVMAGVDGEMTARVLAWLTATAVAAGLAGGLTSTLPVSKNSADLTIPNNGKEKPT
jgi:hypothetical protein